MATLRDFSLRLIENVETVIVGKRFQLELLMVALLCQGHVLIEDVPGTGKTMLARAAAASLGLSFKRVQCTPDLLPNDITGVSVFNQQAGTFDFRPGPVFVNILLADEINRATPRPHRGGAAGSHAGTPGDGGRRHAPAGHALRGAGHSKPHRIRGHLSLARGAA